MGEFARRLTGSNDLYGRNGRTPSASINFITAHDGFTLHDLVSYNDKHNEANGEENRDGSNNNLSWNCGVEGPTEDASINALRERQKRNLLATLLLSQGVPMLLAGDEMGRTQRGNNNAYCQDNELAWTDWNIDPVRRNLLEFVSRMIDTRRNHPILRRRQFFLGRPANGSPIKDIVWLRPDGAEMTDQEWDEDSTRCLGVFLSGDALPETDRRGRPVRDASFLLLFNAYHDSIAFRLPAMGRDDEWFAQIDTAFDSGRPPPGALRTGLEYPLQGRSLALLRRIDVDS
jgi:glycogen operon protein